MSTILCADMNQRSTVLVLDPYQICFEGTEQAECPTESCPLLWVARSYVSGHEDITNAFHHLTFELITAVSPNSWGGCRESNGECGFNSTKFWLWHVTLKRL